ncbi:MAG: SDR family oxidoreductase [Chitinophagales bacterium]
MSAKTIVVSGASKGIGRAIVLKFAAAGYAVAVCARNQDDLKQLEQEVSAVSSRKDHLFVSADVRQKAELNAFAKAILVQWPAIDILVNNAGVFIPGQVIHEHEGTLEQLIETNVYSAYHLTRALLPNIQKPGGSIFNMCSIASLQAYANGGSYSISKFALLGFSKALREELKPMGVKVTAVMPGATKTDSWKGSDLPDDRFIAANDIGKLIFDLVQLSPTADVEEVTIRPLPGDI